MGDTGREEKKSAWFQENFMESHVKLHCSKKPLMGGLPSQLIVC